MGRVGHIWPVFNKKISTSKGAPVASSRIPSEKEPQDAAYARAQDAIATARTSDASALTLSGDDFADLAVLPPDIGSLTALKNLNLLGTEVSDISALSGLTALSRLYLSSTPVSDLSPLLPLTQLAEAFSRSTTGLAFKNTAAAQADPRIAEIAEIRDNAKRATDLFAYLKNVNLTQTAQYHTLLSTRLMRASIGDFQFDSLARVMRLMPFEEDLRRLRDPVQLARFLEGAEDLCEGLQTLSTALKASSGNMYAAQITPYLDGVIDTLGRAEQSHTLSVGKVIEYGEALEDFSVDAATRAELSDPLSKDLTRQVNSLLDLARNHFADTFLRFAPLQNIEMAPNQTPIQALAQVEALLRDTRAAACDLVPLAKEDDAVFTHMMRSIEKLTRAHGQATSDSDRASYRREINYHLAMVTVSIGLYAAKARHHVGNIGPVIDRVLEQTKRVKGLQELVEMIEGLLPSSAH
mgnify:CR=1 FL=1